MSRYSLEYRAPRQKKWHALSVSKLVPFPAAELAGYQQMIAERLTALRGVAVLPEP